MASPNILLVDDEDRADWDFLRQQGGGLAQGYFIAGPMPAGELHAWLADWKLRHPELIAAVSVNPDQTAPQYFDGIESEGPIGE